MSKKTLKKSTFLLPCPIGLITTQGSDGKPNIITLAWIGIISSEPPMVSISVRLNRHSHKILLENKDFVINVANEKDLQRVDFCGMTSGRNTNKFKEANFTSKPANEVKAPIIVECPVNIECRVKNMITFGTHDVFLAEVLSVQVDEEIVDKDGNWDIEKVNPLVYCPPPHEYWTMGKKVGNYGFSKGKI